MNTTELKPGSQVWIVWSSIGGSWQLAREIAKDVCTGDGSVYQPKHGDDCYVRWNRRVAWVKHDKVFLTESAAKAELSRRLRAHAAVLLRQADELEACLPDPEITTLEDLRAIDEVNAEYCNETETSFFDANNE